MPTLDTVLEKIRDRVSPSDAAQADLEATVAEVLGRAESAIEDLPVDATAVLVGSTARDTWLASDRDIDVFVRFPQTLSRAELEDYGLAVGYEVLPDGHEEYAEHPYVTGTLDGYDVDLVPCYAVDDASDIESAVDRTPFHAEYVVERMTPELAAEVRVLKQFAKAIDVYGSDLRTRGFSGYLIELLVLEYGSVQRILEAASDWQPPVTLDPAEHGDTTFEDALVVIDPTDPSRNVAAVLSRENLARFQHYARDLLADPRVEAFDETSPSPIDAPSVESEIQDRGTTPIALVFETPDLVEDDLYPQIEKSREGIERALAGHGFEPLRSASFVRDRSVLLYELAVATRPAIERHQGPPVHVRSHAEDFYETYAEADVYGPFIEAERYVVEREREFTTAEPVLRSDAVFDARLAPAIEDALRTHREVLVGTDIATLAAEFGTELARYFDPEP